MTSAAAAAMRVMVNYLVHIVYFHIKDEKQVAFIAEPLKAAAAPGCLRNMSMTHNSLIISLLYHVCPNKAFDAVCNQRSYSVVSRLRATGGTEDFFQVSMSMRLDPVLGVIQHCCSSFPSSGSLPKLFIFSIQVSNCSF